MKSRLRHPNHRITDNGHYVCGFKRKTDGYSGRVVEDGEGKWLAVPGYATFSKPSMRWRTGEFSDKIPRYQLYTF